MPGVSFAVIGVHFDRVGVEVNHGEDEQHMQRLMMPVLLAAPAWAGTDFRGAGRLLERGEEGHVVCHDLCGGRRAQP